MVRKKQAELSFIDWAGKAAAALSVLAVAAYVAGCGKFYFLYKALECEWVLNLNSVQDVIANGALDVFICSLSAIPLFYGYRKSEDLDVRGRKVVGFFLVGVLISVVAMVGFYGKSVSQFILDTVTYSCSYLFCGLGVAYTARYALEMGRYQYILVGFVLFAFSTVSSSYLVNVSKGFFSMDSSGGFPYKVYSADGTVGVLISSVNGKYLVRACGESSVYQLIVPGEKWAVATRGGVSCPLQL